MFVPARTLDDPVARLVGFTRRGVLMFVLALVLVIVLVVVLINDDRAVFNPQG